MAGNDTATVPEGATRTITVLANDTDADGTINPATVVITQQPTNGTATVNANGTITYVSNGAEVTTDTFGYTVKDNTGRTQQHRHRHPHHHRGQRPPRQSRPPWWARPSRAPGPSSSPSWPPTPTVAR